MATDCKQESAKNKSFGEAEIARAKGFLNEFKTFALRGNVMDMAVGVVIGAAFSAIINSLVNSIIMPIIGLLTASKSLSALTYKFGPHDTDVLAYGAFIQAVINFVLIAFVVFLMVKFFNRLRRSPSEEPAPPAPTETDLLAEIRDLLKEQK
ncbi:MAG: large-conductance mechanosensitive channel protein MscL [Clostridiales Family XIII bacterium]|jgi:large conductance mechanosensitive channel|nr:large-conductance mechanosensitive channel protein MscL [Clostridiales Family XIII bacterium]